MISTLGKTTTTDEHGGAAAFSALHPDIIQTHILTCLDGPSLASISSTCSQLNNLSLNDDLWSKTRLTMWPSTGMPYLRHVISTFPNASRAFFVDSFSTVSVTRNCHRANLGATSEIFSAVDLFHRQRLLLARVVDTETKSDWFISAPFRVDILDPKDTIETDMEYPRNKEEFENLEEELRMSWIVINPIKKRAMNVSSGKPVSVNRHWLTGDVKASFATILDGGEKGSATEKVVCSVLVTLGSEMQVKEVCFRIEDMDGIVLNGKGSLGILVGALEGERKRMRKENERKEKYEEFVKRKMERKERKLRSEKWMDVVFMALCALFVGAFFILCV